MKYADWLSEMRFSVLTVSAEMAAEQRKVHFRRYDNESMTHWMKIVSQLLKST